MKVPELYIEQLLLGELPPDKEAVLLADHDVVSRMEEIKLDNEEVLRQYPVRETTRAIRWKFEQEKLSRNITRRLLPAAGIAAVLIAAVSLAVLIPPGSRVPSNIPEETRIKGLQPHLVVYRKTSSDPEMVAAESTLQARDILQISYVAAGKKYGTIFSIDGRGAVTLHFPLTTASSPLLEQDGQTLLKFAYELDDAPDFERFFFVITDQDFRIEEILNQAQKLAQRLNRARIDQLKLDGEFEQSSIIFTKKGSIR